MAGAADMSRQCEVGNARSSNDGPHVAGRYLYRTSRRSRRITLTLGVLECVDEENVISALTAKHNET
jgi:hypothetical protein